MRFHNSMLRGAPILAAFLVLASSSLVGAGEEEDAKAAEKAALTWLGHIDKGEHAKSWEEASSFFKGAVPKDTWVQQLKGVRAPLGKLSSRKLEAARPASSLPGAPDGRYVVMSFRASFEKKKSAIETVTAQLDKDGSWRISGYFIK